MLAARAFRLLCVLAAAAIPIAAQGTHDGTWNGTTAQGKTFSFVVVNNSVSSVTYGYHLVGSGCTSDSTSTTNFGSPVPLSGNSIQLNTSGPVSISVSGSFTSASQASGSLNVVSTLLPGVPGCAGSVQTTWTASLDITPPFGSFDTPANNTGNIAGAVAVTGWALDNIGVTKVEIYRDPVPNEAAGNFGWVFIGNANFVTGARPDVQGLYPSFPNANRAGWGYQMLTNFLPNSDGGAGNGNGTYHLHAVAYDSSGNHVELGAPGKTILCDNAHGVNPFGTIDTPVQGGSTAGSQFVNFGWALAQNPNCIPTNGSTISVIVDGVSQGHPVYNQMRSDIASLFPGRCNSTGAVGYFLLDTTKLTNGVHTIQWVAYDDHNNGDGLGSRYFSVGNGVSNAFDSEAPLDDLESPAETTWRRGYDESAVPESLPQDSRGAYFVEIEECSRLELRLGAGSGYMLANGERQTLPVGSTLQRGVFSWQLGPGFNSEYDLVFARPGQPDTQVHIAVRPKRYLR